MQCYEGVVLSTNGSGDTTGVTLKDVKDLSNPGTPLKDTFFIASTNIDSWASGPADAKIPNGATDSASVTTAFRTDVDIAQKVATRRDHRELHAWQPGMDHPPAATLAAGQAQGDELTFGIGSNATTSWDQFAVNEKLFGVTATYDEDVYTTKLDRSGPDFKDRERQAQKIANEITGVSVF